MIDGLREPDRNQTEWAQPLPAQAFVGICYRRADLAEQEISFWAEFCQK
jgi:hypothetical protein